jgi:multiple sugar transport system permease protein
MIAKSKPAFTLERFYHYAELIFVYALVLAGAMLTAMPFVWMFLTSFKGSSDVASIPMRWLPTVWRFDNYGAIWDMVPFTRFYLNSIFIAVTQTLGVLLTSSMAAFAFARIKFYGRDVIFILYLGTIMIPGWVTLLPSFLIIRDLGWLNTYQGVIIPGLTSVMGTFLLRQFFLSVPKDYEDSAFLDGANRWNIYSRIVIPLARPALLTVGLMTFMGSWNSLLWPMLIMSDVEKQTLPLGLARLALTGGWVRIEWGPLMAATLLSLLPVIIIYLFLQNYFIKGIALSGLK